MKEKHKQMYMRVAEAVAQTSSARRLQVGAVAVKGNMVIATGYNGLPSGVEGDCETKVYPSHPFLPVKEDDEYPYLCDEYVKENGRKAKYKLVTKPEVLHAEENLILNLAKSTESASGCDVYLTHSCCKKCSMKLVDVGVKKVYYKNLFRCTEGLDYLKANGVEIEQVI